MLILLKYQQKWSMDYKRQQHLISAISLIIVILVNADGFKQRWIQILFLF